MRFGADRSKKPLFCIFALMALGLMVFFRVYALSSDAYPRLSWSSALLTDEGFYLHNARNLLLFHHTTTDDFNNDLIMPYLHYAQILTFHLLGTGLTQDRLLSVLTSLLTLPLLFFPTQRLFGTPTALLATLLWGLSHANFLYNRLALMDTPGAFVLSLGWALWVLGWLAQERKGVWMGLSGLVLGGVYGVRGLGALVWGVPLALLVWERRWRLLAWWSGGLAASLLFYLLWWYLPHYAQIQHMNHYYINVQLEPHSMAQLWHNVREAFFSWGRGLWPYLMKHMPIEPLMASYLLVSAWRQTIHHLQTRRLSIQEINILYLLGWIGVFVLFLCVVNYAPSRYYVLFYPALSILAAVGLKQVAETFLHGKVVLIGLLLLWGLVNTYWTTDWLTHLTYRQEAADRWLGEHLPANAVVFGAVAPGLCINNHLLPICMIAGLCNDHHPVERFAGRPRYILILDNNGKDHRWREQWWVQHYPDLVDPKRRIHAFRHILRPFFTIGLYEVPPNWPGERALLQAKTGHTKKE